MLQQTQVSRVIDYYERFLDRFPSVKSLSQAKWRELLPYWRGLGYYQRGRNLLSTANLIVKRPGAKFPKDVSELRQLPGIGPYTANALLSFAFGEPTPAIDTNLKRVIQRFWGVEFPQAAENLEAEFQLKKANSASLNHALMDVGAMFCRSRTVDCANCPLRPSCVFSRQLNRSSSFPLKVDREQVERLGEQSRKIEVDVGAACIHRDGKFLIAQTKEGLWEFPGGKREAGEDIRSCLKREIQEELGIEISVRPSFLKTDFVKDKRSHRLHFCRCQILRGRPKAKVHKKLLWVEKTALSSYRFRETNLDAVQRLGGMAQRKGK